jgi:transcriptional regulator with XRE-family HTH domain
MTIGERLRRERVRAGLTQTELAARLGVTKGQVWKVEHGARPAQAALIERWSRETGAAYADLVLDGPPLFDLAFPADAEVIDPLTARQILYRLPAQCRRQAAVWPGAGDGVLRLRVRGSALPTALDLAGSVVPGAGQLRDPVVTPVRAAEALAVWVRASSETAALRQVEARLAGVAAQGRITLNSMGRLFVVVVADLGARASVQLQDLVKESPIGLFVPAGL